MLNKRTFEKIEQMVGAKMDWENAIRARLGGGIRMQARNVMMIPWMRRMVAKYHDKSKTQETQAIDKQEKERQQLLAMKGKGQWEIGKSMRGDGATPMAALRRKGRGPRGQPLGRLRQILNK